ncbi:hypothetical protein JCM10449v2_004502 [Rhodotorula kratochvilovae]
MSSSTCAPGQWSYYAYDPMRSMTYVALSLFAVIFFAQLALIIKYRTRYASLMIPFLIGMLGESCGYIFRRISADNSCGRGSALTWYLLQELFLILCPALMCASFYMCFGRIITFVGEKWTPIPSKWVTITFVTIDIVSFVVQGAGGSLYSSDNTKIYPTAKAILLVGFIIQIIGLGLFSIFAVIYQIRAKHDGVPSGAWTRCLYTLYAGSVCVLIRGIFRTIEFGTGRGGKDKGYLLSVEGYFYGLEFGPILLAGLILTLSYPGRYIPHARVRMYPSLTGEDESAETAGSGEKVELEGASEGRRWWRRS